MQVASLVVGSLPHLEFLNSKKFKPLSSTEDEDTTVAKGTSHKHITVQIREIIPQSNWNAAALKKLQLSVPRSACGTNKLNHSI
ncbi:hypothetical protein Mapa_013581 [Marchantia paleacea]|nr:hypothetical protein Mapa_013581 [Marchantia paleacea]